MSTQSFKSKHSNKTPSLGQQALCLNQYLFPSSAAYNVPLAWWVRSPIDPRALHIAFQALVDRHDALRARYPMVSDGFEMRIAERMEVDFEAAPAPRNERDLLAALQDEADSPFDLAIGPVLRVRLWQAPAGDPLLLVVAHHVSLDGWSIRILLQDLGALYAAAISGRSSELAPPGRSFGQWVEDEEERLAGHLGERQKAYWHRQLRDAPSILDLPTDHPRPSVPSDCGGAVPGRLEATAAREVSSIASAHRTTPFVVLVAAFQALLRRYSGQDDILIGTPTAGRRASDIAGVIGYFVNPVALRADFRDDPSFNTHVARAREAVLDAFDHQDYPFPRLARELDPDRGGGQHPLFQVVFTLLPSPPPELADLYTGRMGFTGGRLELEGLVLEAVPLEEGAARFDLTLLVSNRGDEWVLRLQYDAGLFQAATARRLLTHYRILLAAALEQPETAVSELPWLGPAERHQLCLEWNHAAVVNTVAVEPTVLDQFARQVRERSEAVALVAGDQALCYGELARRAAHIAHRLSVAGLGTEARVGICMERTVDLVVAILGTLTAGATYVPLDPAYPSRRLRYLLRDCGARVVLCDAVGEARLPTASGFGEAGWLTWRLTGLSADTDRETAEGFSPAPVTTEQLAYVIYTSGSTGQPKGVGVTHGNLARLFSATQPWFRFDTEDIWTLFHSYAFDFSVWEIWGALAYGGRLVVVPDVVRTSPPDFLRLLTEQMVTVLNQTPSAFRQLIRADEEAEVAWAPALRRVIFGGEALELETLRPWIRRHGDRKPQLINMYGITETTVHVTYRPIDAADLETAGGSMIGEPIPDLTVQVLDRRRRPVPIGVPGELCVGGAGLARGYLGRRELSAQRFVPDGFGRWPGARLYRSGDLARRSGNGDLEYLGRIDHQVKVRGHRIELGEVETALGEDAAVREAVVLADGSGDATRLVAYVVAAQASAPAVESLQERLRARVPEYMVPALFVFLEAFPLTRHGKLDRGALPKPAADRDSLQKAYVAPRTGAEAALAAAWAEVLELDRVGVEDPFFALGGDSIRGVRMVTAARRRGLVVSLQDLFQWQTVAALAERATPVEEKQEPSASGRPESRSLLAPEDRRRLPSAAEDSYPLTTLQVGMLVEGERDSTTPLYHNVNGLWLRAPLVPPGLRRAIGVLLERHPVLRTSFHLEGFSEPVQIVHRRVKAKCPVVDLSVLPRGVQEREIDRWFVAETSRRYELRQPPLLRFVAHRLDAETFHLGLSEHHVLADGWSMAVVRSELLQLYAAELGDLAPNLGPAPEATFSAFVAAERQAAADPAARDFWEHKMQGAPRARLPRRTASSAVSRRVKYQPVRVSNATLAGLLRLARSEGVALKHVLLAGHLRVLAQLTGERDLVTGMVTHGRPEVEGTERIVGLFVNSLPLRLKVPSAVARGWVGKVAAAEQEILAHRAFPLTEIQSLAGGGRLFEALFNFVHFHVSEALDRLTRVQLLQRRLHAETELPLVATFKLHASGDHLEARLEGDLGELSEADLARFASLYEEALKALAAAPEGVAVPLSLPALERHRLLVEWSTEGDASAVESLPALFSRQAALHPDAPALLTEDRRWSYSELDAETNRLARALRRRGVGPEDRVGFLLERSPEAIQTILAIVKAGGVYVPLDPGSPRQRLLGILEDAEVQLMVILGNEAVDIPTPTFSLEGEAEKVAAESSGPLSLAQDPDQLAYVMFTSGSTGRPKAVAVSHRAVARLVADGQFAEFGPQETWLLFASLSFDVSTLEIWGALGRGGPLALMPSGVASLSALGEAIQRHGVSSLWLTAGLFHRMVDEMPLALTSLRQLIAGGDTLSPAHVRHLLALAPDLRLVNGYGPTENTTFTSCHPMVGAAGASGIVTSVPIGRPINNTRVYVFDPELRPVPAGVEGELLTGGVGLARGYLKNPARTAESFVPDPLSTLPGERLYHTGDQARWHESGRLEFLGRRDGQVKVRGFRIETAAVAQVLEAHPAVREAVVLARGEAAESKELVAYVVPGEPAPAADELRALAAETLPAHALPGRFCFMEALPLTPNGKVDRRALPEPEGSAPKGGVPRGPVEELVVSVWSGLLERRIGVDDNVFDLGAHSLTAVGAASRLRRALGREIPLGLLFDHSTPALQAAVLSTQAADAPPPTPPLLAGTRPAELPLSPAQERLWFFHRFEPDAATYNVPLVYELRGALSESALARALGAVVERHEVLRTVYRSSEGQPIQQVLSAGAVADLAGLARIDLSALTGARQRSEAWRLAEQAVRRPFDLATEPPLRALLLRQGPREWLLVLTVHHIAFDGTSAAVLHRELAAFYSATTEGPAFEPLAVQYADYALWQREVLETASGQNSLKYWRQRLEHCNGLELPGDRPRSAVRVSRGGAVSRASTGQGWQELEALTQRRTVTRFMVFATAFTALLARRAERKDVVFGTPSGQRTPEGAEPLIGCFINPLVLRLDASGDPPFEELLERVRRQALADYPHAHYPFERLVEELVPQRDLARPPLFQILFAVDQSAPLELPSVEIEPVQVSLEAAKYDLAFEVTDARDGSGLRATFSRGLYDATTVARFLRAFETLLGSALQDPQRPLSRLEVLAPGERQQLLHEWSDARCSAVLEPVHRAFEAQADATPDAVAVEAGSYLSYGELERRANVLADRVQQLGGRPEVAVGVALPRTENLLVTLLGILKTGAFYVPLDLDYPADRLAYVLEDSGVSLLVTDRASLASLPISRAQQLLLDEQDFHGQAVSRQRIPAHDDDLAYSIYTSGSTGRPKGVQIGHRALANYLADVGPRTGLRAGGRLLAVTPLSFDISAFELFGPLVSGATVVLADRTTTVDGAALATRLAKSRIELMQATPATWSQMVGQGWSKSRGLTVLCGGEALPSALAKEILRRCDALWNLYGPTETTIFSTVAPLAAEGGAAEVTLGRAIANTRVHVVDGRGAACTVGTPGEVFLGGDGLARGYLGKAALTAERFVPDPFSGLVGERLYGTGDVGQCLRDGRLHYLGRRDHQVKLRGFRIELGEIEKVLEKNPAVEGAVVALREQDAAQLVAWYTASDELPVDSLTAFLRRSLPAYMLPGAFVHLRTFPKTPNNKVDRKALPDPDGARPRMAVRYLAPRTEMERSVAAVYRQVLELEEVGLNDNFFDLGGNSMLAVAVLDRLPVDQACRPTLVDLFRYPSVRSMAAQLQGSEEPTQRLAGAAKRADLRRQARRTRRRAM